MFLGSRCQWGCLRRGMASVSKSHYDTLGVKASATQAEIKTAYYDLSKQYHPDTNQGSKESLAKFRQVNDAYETLGNVKSRKMYDRGLVVGVQSGTYTREDVEDDPTTRFYKRRETRHKVPTPLDRTTVYNFDAWARAHYVNVKDRRTSEKEKFDHKVRLKSEVERMRELNKYYFTLVFVLLLIAVFGRDNQYDRPLVNKPKTKEGT